MNKQKRGFTFLEVMAVMTLISIIMALTVATYAATEKNEQLKSGCRRLASFISYLQSTAVFRGENMKLIYDLENNTYRAEYPEVDVWDDEEFVVQDELPVMELPDKVKLISVATGAFEVSAFDEVRIDFNRDGWVTPHLVQLGIDLDSAKPRIFTLQIIPLTGQVKIYEGDVDWYDVML